MLLGMTLCWPRKSRRTRAGERRGPRSAVPCEGPDRVRVFTRWSYEIDFIQYGHIFYGINIYLVKDPHIHIVFLENYGTMRLGPDLARFMQAS